MVDCIGQVLLLFLHSRCTISQITIVYPLLFASVPDVILACVWAVFQHEWEQECRPDSVTWWKATTGGMYAHEVFEMRTLGTCE